MPANRSIGLNYGDYWHSVNESILVFRREIDGAGVVLGWWYLARDDLAAGRLLQAFDIELPLGSAIYFVCPKALSTQTKLSRFLNWMLDEIGE